MKSTCIRREDTKYWVIPGTGISHREDGPAIEWFDGDKYWYFNGLRHREDGPAIENDDGNIYWCLNGGFIRPTFEMMEKYIRLNPDNILKNYPYPLEIQILAISLKSNVIYNIPYPDPELKKLYPKQMALRDIGST